MNSSLIDDFLNYIHLEKRYSINTYEAYQRDLNQFDEFVKSIFNIEQIELIDHHTVRSWIISLMDEEYSATTINRKLSTLKAFFKFLLKEGITSSNAASKIKPIKTPSRLPEFIEPEKLNLILDTTFDNENFSSLLETLIVELFYGTGIRLSELLNLKNQDIDLHLNEIKVIGKGNKQRLIPLNNTLIRLIPFYSSKKDDLNSNNQDYFFVKEDNQKVSKSFVYRTVKKKLNEINTQTKTSPHVLRHTFATHLLNSGADLNAIKDLLGHSSLASTQVYTHNDLDKLKKVFRQAHPKA